MRYKWLYDLSAWAQLEHLNDDASNVARTLLVSGLTGCITVVFLVAPTKAKLIDASKIYELKVNSISYATEMSDAFPKAHDMIGALRFIVVLLHLFSAPCCDQVSGRSPHTLPVSLLTTMLTFVLHGV